MPTTVKTSPDKMPKLLVTSSDNFMEKVCDNLIKAPTMMTSLTQMPIAMNKAALMPFCMPAFTRVMNKGPTSIARNNPYDKACNTKVTITRTQR